MASSASTPPVPEPSESPEAAPATGDASLATGWSIGQDYAPDLDALIARIEAGFTADSVEALRGHLGLSIEEMAGLLGMSARTLGRRLEGGKLTAEESDRLYRYARLFERAVEVLGSEEKARAVAGALDGLGGPVELVGRRPDLPDDLLRRLDELFPADLMRR